MKPIKTKEELAGLIDHTQLKAFSKKEDIERLCGEAMEYGFASVCVNSCNAALCAGLLKGSGVHVCTTISFPLGQTDIETKLFETKNAIANGADEIDYVVNISRVRDNELDYVEREMSEIVELCKERGAISKAIFENCYLTDDEKVALCEIAARVKPDFIKTSTGFGTGGATAEDVALMKSHVGDGVQVKAAGGIRTLSDCLRMLEAGATRIGASAGVSIIKEFEKNPH